MRILRVIARIAQKALITETEAATVNDDYTYNRRENSKYSDNLLKALLKNDDVRAIRQLMGTRQTPSIIKLSGKPMMIREIDGHIAVRDTINLSELAVRYDAIRVLGAVIRHAEGESISIVAADMGKINALRWLEENDYTMAEDLCYFAVQREDLDTLKWLRAHQYSWDLETTERAVDTRNVKLLDYMWRSSAPWPGEEPVDIALGFKDTEMLDWLIRAGCPLMKDICKEINEWMHQWTDKYMGTDLFMYKRTKTDRERLLDRVREVNRCDCGGKYHMSA